MPRTLTRVTRQRPDYRLLAELDHLPRLIYAVSLQLVDEHVVPADITALYDALKRAHELCWRTGLVEVAS